MELILTNFELLRILVCSTMLGSASYFDLKYREIPDFLWLGFAGIGIVLLFFQLDDAEFQNKIIISMLFSVPLSIIFWKSGLFGGADAFALMSISFLAPFGLANEVYPTTVLTNSLLLILGVFVFNLLRNSIKYHKDKNLFDGFTESKLRKIVALMVGTKSNTGYGFPIEQKTKRGKKFKFALKHAENTNFVSGKWVSLAFPFLLFISVGFCIQIVLGDLLFLWV